MGEGFENVNSALTYVLPRIGKDDAVRNLLRCYRGVGTLRGHFGDTSVTQLFRSSQTFWGRATWLEE